ncbi:hypothetical protein Hanom_Chr16g01519381 [Helianthus anomalus]
MTDFGWLFNVVVGGSHCQTASLNKKNIIYILNLYKYPLILPYLFIFYKINPQHPTMYPFNRNDDLNNPFGYQENPNPSLPPNRPPPNPTQIPITRGHPQQQPHGLLYSPCPDLAGIASYIGNRVYTNFPYDDSSIPVSLSQPESVSETQPQDVSVLFSLYF